MDTNNWKRAFNDKYPQGGLEYKGRLVQTEVIADIESLLAQQKEQIAEEERIRSSLIVESLMEDTEYWQPIASRILERTIIRKDDILSPTNPKK